jgi:hypothetical protein
VSTGAVAFATRNEPLAMMSCWKSQSFSVVSSSGLLSDTPALFTTMSSPPKASTASCTIFSIAAASVTFTCRPIATSGPPISAAASWAFARSRSAITTHAPSAARRVAMALPIPDAAPVTSAMRVAWDFGFGIRCSFASSSAQYSIANFSASEIGV